MGSTPLQSMFSMQYQTWSVSRSLPFVWTESPAPRAVKTIIPLNSLRSVGLCDYLTGCVVSCVIGKEESTRQTQQLLASVSSWYWPSAGPHSLVVFRPVNVGPSSNIYRRCAVCPIKMLGCE